MKNFTSIAGKPTSGISKPALNRCLAILDVGHGNSAVLVDSEGVVVIDTGLGSSLLEYLLESEITTIDAVVLSHADDDHIGGLVQVLSCGKFHIRSVHLNTDSAKGSRRWDDLLYELERTDLKGELDFNTSLTRGSEAKLDRTEVQVEILGPSKYLAAKGPGSTDRIGRKLTSNSVSAVTRLSKGGKPIALLPGDLDHIGLDDLRASEVDATAPIVVFPHHGGRTGSTDLGAFAKNLCELTSPAMVIFSIGRGRHSTPRPEIVAAIREGLSEVWIACTQLSEHCASGLPISSPKHLNDSFAQGREGRKCCAGTIVIDLDDPTTILPQRSNHESFIREMAPTALCREQS